MSIPDRSTLARWLISWVQPSGAIHGFHNHSVWGDNPYRYGDFTSGHSTFASPLIPALAHAYLKQPDPRGFEFIQRLLHFQAHSHQPNGQFAHVGFQVGEMLTHGLVHNAMPLVSLCSTVLSLRKHLDPALISDIGRACDLVFAATDRAHGPSPNKNACTNQEYVRLWARLLHMRTFDHKTFDAQIPRDIDFLIENAHIKGLPDEQSIGTLRCPSDPTFIEPAEYYGLMIPPLLLAHERYSNNRYLEQAIAIARHVVRSAWMDSQSQTRVHRLYHRINDKWHCTHEPILIGGIGLTLASIHALNRVQPDEELESFLAKMDRAYAHYQSPSGFFLSATGWFNEADLVPSSAWQSHDLFHLIQRHPVAENFWNTVFTPDSTPSVVLGESLFYFEHNQHWQIRGYHSAHGAELIGRKDRGRFFIDIPRWIGSGKEPPSEFQISNRPEFVRTKSEIIQITGPAQLYTLANSQLKIIPLKSSQ